MMTMSNMPKPDGGFYKVGDALATEEQAIAFAQAVGWKIIFYIGDSSLLRCKDNTALTGGELRGGYNLPYTIKGFLPEHTATATTPNPPLTFEEAIELSDLWLVWPEKIKYGAFDVYNITKGGNPDWWHASVALYIDKCIQWGGKVYGDDPATHPPTPREEG